jgi:hypothetical protein
MIFAAVRCISIPGNVVINTIKASSACPYLVVDSLYQSFTQGIDNGIWTRFPDVFRSCLR